MKEPPVLYWPKLFEGWVWVHVELFELVQRGDGYQHGDGYGDSAELYDNDTRGDGIGVWGDEFRPGDGWGDGRGYGDGTGRQALREDFYE